MTVEIKRFFAKIISKNRITIPQELVAVWQMQEGELWGFEILHRVEVQRDA